MIQKIHKGCGGIIMDIVLTSMPPINQEKCMKCGKVFSSEQEKMIIEEVE